MKGYYRIQKMAKADNRRKIELNKNKEIKVLTLPNGIGVKAYEERNTSGSTSYVLVVDKFICGYMEKYFYFSTPRKG